MKTFYTVLFVLFASLWGSHATAQVDILMKLTDRNNNMVNGESQIPNFVGWSELLSSASSIIVPLNVSSQSAGTVAGRATVDTFPIQMRLSSVSVPLMQNLVTGTTFNAVDIWFRKAFGSSSCACAYYKVHMEQVAVNNIISSVDSSGTTQQVNFVPRRMAWAYYQTNAGGTPATTPTNSYGWDFTSNIFFSYNF